MRLWKNFVKPAVHFGETSSSEVFFFQDSTAQSLLYNNSDSTTKACCFYRIMVQGCQVFENLDIKTTNYLNFTWLVGRLANHEDSIFFGWIGTKVLMSINSGDYAIALPHSLQY